MKTVDKIVSSLKSTQDYVSGEVISRELNISRAGIWKYIEELRQAGYQIDAVPHLGYKLIAVPDKLLPDEIKDGLETVCLGQRIVHLEEVTSTMEHALKLSMEGAPEGTLVCAESQTAGRGRLGRSWISPRHQGIYMSLILKPALAPTEIAPLTLLSAVALCEALRFYVNDSVSIKWPNDLLIQKKKVAGILTELQAEMDYVKFVVVGMGVNVNTPNGLLPTNSISVKQVTKGHVSRVALVQKILYYFEYWYERFKHEGAAIILDQWRYYNSTLGKPIRLVDARGAIEGTAVDIDEWGSLMIRTSRGIVIKRMSGDVYE